MGSGFRDIQFGFASAEMESSESPELLLKAFLDPHDVVLQLTKGQRFLLLGSKGTGKSAAGLHLALQASANPECFVRIEVLKDFSFRSLRSVVDGEVEPEVEYPRAWSWLLLLALIAQVDSDSGATHSDPVKFARAVKSLRSAGLLPARTLGDLLVQSGAKHFELEAFNIRISGGAEDQGPRGSLATLVHQLRDLLGGISTKSRHFLIIDGLDDILIATGDQFKALSGLILEASRLNQFFRELKAPFKIIVLCRTDIFERLPGPNQNKLRQDLAIELNWYAESSDAMRSRLVQLCNLRAQLADPETRDLFARYFPRKMGGKTTGKYLLEFTRHTPRDLLQLLKFIQTAWEDDSHFVSHGAIRAGIRAYADRYFLPEIKDELDGFYERSVIDSMMEALRQFHRPDFERAELADFLRDGNLLGESVDLDAMLASLYHCSAIGNVHTAQDGVRRHSFRYRNPSSAFSRNDRIVVHNGLRRALLLPGS